jgi:hypothetical protein
MKLKSKDYSGFPELFFFFDHSNLTTEPFLLFQKRIQKQGTISDTNSVEFTGFAIENGTVLTFFYSTYDSRG